MLDCMMELFNRVEVGIGDCPKVIIVVELDFGGRPSTIFIDYQSNGSCIEGMKEGSVGWAGTVWRVEYFSNSDEFIPINWILQVELCDVVVADSFQLDSIEGNWLFLMSQIISNILSWSFMFCLPSYWPFLVSR